MNIVRQLTEEEYEKWDEFVVRSPQGSLFQTIGWNRMQCETDPQLAGFLPLVSFDEKGVMQAGIIVCYRMISGKKVVELPMFGYVSPILAAGMDYADRQHTYRNYLILAELLKELLGEVDRGRLKNAPEIWDIRPYTFQSWEIETMYTHIWKQMDMAEAWKLVDPEMQKMIETGGHKYDFEVTDKEGDIEEYIQLSGGGEVLRRRLLWLRERGLGRLCVVKDQGGRKSGMTLAIVSRENQAAYLWGSQCIDMKLEQEILSYLFWKSYEALGREFLCLDMGASEKYSVGLVKDKLGGEPTPQFITTNSKK
jgi:hypothetical protein